MAAVVVAHLAGGWQVARVAALQLALSGGLTLPDIDQLLPLLDHRDALTHSLLPALALLAWPQGRERLHAVAAGLALGLALHMAADCFPQAMVGFGTIKLPFAGSIGRWSYLWLGANAVAGAVMFGVLLPSLRLSLPLALLVLGGAVITGAGYLLRVDGGWWALASILLVGWGVSRVAALRAMQ